MLSTNWNEHELGREKKINEKERRGNRRDKNWGTKTELKEEMMIILWLENCDWGEEGKEYQNSYKTFSFPFLSLFHILYFT